jgi:two-component system phosphate regulon sensor histidine kinase PhoR
MQTKRQAATKLFKAVGLISLAPTTVILVYALLGRLSLEHAAIAIMLIVCFTAIFIHPYISNISALTDYVKALAQDRKTDEPDLSFLNNLEELSGAVEELHNSWEARRNQLEAAVAENKIVIEVLPDALFILDKEQRIVRTNGMARLMFGHRIIHKKLEEVLPVTDLINAVENVTQVKDVEFQRMDGEIKRDFIAKVTKFPASSPSTTDVIVTLHDLTLLKQIRKMQADFVANASHEMKTPLASIIGLTETLQSAAKDDIEARDEFLKIIYDQANRMKKLVEDLLSLSKIEADTTPPADKVDLVRVIAESTKHCEWAAKQKNVRIRIDIKNDLPIILGDEGQLGQVMNNLISNAIKYGHSDSEVLVEAKITRKLPVDLSEKFDKAIEISVIDQSEGIAPEHLPRLTERFYRVDSGRSKKLGGTGLGLAIVKHIMNRHSGTLDIKSKTGMGSIFSIYLPLRDGF